MNGTCNINGFIGKMLGEDGKPMTPFVTFLDVAAQVERQKGITHLDVYITTPGGLCEEGDDIVNYFEVLKSKGVTIHTHAQKMVYSFGADILLAGQQRFIDEDCKLMIHNPWVTLTEGDADKVDAYAKELRKLENKSLDNYSSKTGTSKEALKTLMKKDTFLTPQQAVEFGFATSISPKVQLKAVAFSKKFNPNPNEMSKDALSKKDAETLLEKLERNIKQILKPKKLKMVMDSTGDTEITFTDLEPDDVPGVDDVATIDGSPAEGEFVMPSGETYVFAGGILTEIKPKEDGGDGGDTPEEMQALQDEVIQLKKAAKKDAETIKALKKSAAEKDETISEHAKMLKSIQKDMKQLKKSISSDFEADEEEGNEGKNGKGGNGKPKSRQLFKPKK